MHPILMEIGSFPLYTYGLILALAISSGLAMAGYLAHRRGWPALEVVDIGLWSTLIGLVGARLGFILQRPELFRDNWWQVLNFRAGGITIIGALIFGNLALILLCRRYRFSPWFCVDIYAAPLLWGMALGRVGCIMQGCCAGKICDPQVLWAFTYPVTSKLAGVPRYPSQLYELLLDLGLMAFCLWLAPRARFQGQVFWSAVGGYGLIRLVVEFFREGALWGPLTLAQWVSLALVLAALVGVCGGWGKPPLVSPPAPKPEEEGQAS